MEQFLIILGVVWLAVLSPGADFAMISRVSSIEGRLSGILVAFGIAIACWFHISYAIFGIGIVERVFPNLLHLIKIAGAAYLVYLGVSMMVAPPVAVQEQAGTKSRSRFRPLGMGILTNGLNPKTSLFIVSLYAQFTGRDTPLDVKLGYGVLISLSHLFWFVTVATFLSSPKVRLVVMAHQRGVNRAIGAVLVVLGVLLAVTDLS